MLDYVEHPFDGIRFCWGLDLYGGEMDSARPSVGLGRYGDDYRELHDRILRGLRPVS